ncbi:nucleolar complex-associated protein 3 [Choiromyces venosus 120613-1]|uniref:Nucleolar complex-associated protein 3 n=1 Tax=Choiromyces venosus 120613-1 TaxID=1336337 RepID=A0A3N4J4N5_9PEZI|nr:nucleolar complex-associated protein 3 [Choiromyces venosus 120613-1]
MKAKSQSGHPFAAAAHWNLEQSYENQPRNGSNKRKTKEKPERTRLPIKTATGIVQVPNLPSAATLDEDTESASDDEDEQDGIDPTQATLPSTAPVAAEKPLPLRKRVIIAKEELANIATLINEDPEENVGLLKRLKEISDDAAVQIRVLAVGTMLAVYKDLIPGYRIRALSEEEMKVKVTKEVRKVRGFEQALVTGYSGFVKMLGGLARAGRGGSDKDAVALSKVAINCACGLLAAVPHFNFRTELLKIIVERVSVRAVDETFVKCRTTLEELFRTDEDGGPSCEAVQLLSKMMRAKHYLVDESVLNTFLSLRLLSELDVKGSNSAVDNPRKRKKKDREFRTKKARKLDKEQKASEKEMMEADATVSHEEREKRQSETLKLVFATYFRILKEKPPGLMGATLEGLAKYAHLINLDFFGDLLVALRELVSDAKGEAEEEGEEEKGDKDEGADCNVVREALLCIITAFALLSGQGEGITIDLTFFTTHLYATLLPLCLSPDLELTTKSLRLPDPHSPLPAVSSSRINLSTEIELLLRALSSIFFSTAHQKSTTPLRLASFTKRLLTTALQTPEKSSLALLGLLNKLAIKHGRKLSALFSTEEVVGDGVWDGRVDEPEMSNPFAATAWEVVLLRRHYSPKVAEAAAALPGMFAERGREG